MASELLGAQSAGAAPEPEVIIPPSVTRSEEKPPRMRKKMISSQQNTWSMIPEKRVTLGSHKTDFRENVSPAPETLRAHHHVSAAGARAQVALQ